MNEKGIQRFNYTFEDGIWAMDQKPEGKWVRYSDHESALATARKEAREAAFRDIRERVEATNPKLTFGSANGNVMKKCILMEISDLEGATHERTVENEAAR